MGNETLPNSEEMFLKFVGGTPLFRKPVRSEASVHKPQSGPSGFPPPWASTILGSNYLILILDMTTCAADAGFAVPGSILRAKSPQGKTGPCGCRKHNDFESDFL